MDNAFDLNCSKCVVCNEMEVIGRRKRRFYRFPRETDKCRAWIRAIGIESLVYMPLAKLYEQVVCDAHFPQECFSQRGSRLHKVTLPTISQYPSLSDNIMALWPKSAMRVNSPETCGLAVNDQTKEAEINLLPDDELTIDYNQPLMTCLETIKHNERYRVKKPAGNANTISVPLMTYSSSLERGTIFSAPEPKNIDFSKLPKLDFHYNSQVEPDNTQTKDFKNVVNVVAPIQQTMKNHRDVVNSKEVFYGLATRIGSKKSVKTTTNSNRTTIKSHNHKQSEIHCKINSIHYLLSKSQFDKSRIINHYKPIKKSINPTVSNSELLDVENASNLQQFTITTNTTKPKNPDIIQDEDSVNELPLEGMLNAEFTYPDHIFGQSTQTEDSTNLKPESSFGQEGDNINDSLSPTQCIGGTVPKDGDQRKRTPITQIDVTIPLMRCMEIVNNID